MKPGRSSNTTTRSWRKNILFAAATLGLLFLILEIVARLILSSNAIFSRIQGNDDTSWRLRWVYRHQPDNEIYYEFDVYHPTRGWALQPNLRNRRYMGGARLSSNSRGLRGTKEYAYGKRLQGVRIVALGDSFTFGEEVSDHETFPARLERLLPNTEVLNMGVHGYGHDQMLITWREEGRRYEPDIVLVGFVYYDMERNLLAFRDYAKPRFTIQGDRLRLTHSPVPLPEELLQREFFQSKLLDLFTIAYHHVAWRMGINERKMQALSIAILDQLIHEICEAGAEPLFVYLPNEMDFKNFFDAPSDHERFFFNFCQGRPVHCLSMRPYFLVMLKQGITLDYYGHWDAKGHLITAYAIRDYLNQQGMLAEIKKRRWATSEP